MPGGHRWSISIPYFHLYDADMFGGYLSRRRRACRDIDVKGPRIMEKLLFVLACLLIVSTTSEASPEEKTATVFEVRPIDWVRKADGQTIIEVDRRYQPAMLGIKDLEAIWVLYWFDRNDTP